MTLAEIAENTRLAVRQSLLWAVRPPRHEHSLRYSEEGNAPLCTILLFCAVCAALNLIRIRFLQRGCFFQFFILNPGGSLKA